MDLFKHLYATLNSLNPALPWILLTAFIFLAVYASRKWAPKLWVWFDTITPDGMIGHGFQALPSVGAGAILSVFLSGGDYSVAWRGAIAGAAAPLLHLILKALPGPYQGAVAAILAKAGIASMLFLLCFCNVSCTAEQGKVAVDVISEVASDVVKVAKVLCEHDQADIQKIDPKHAALFCNTDEQLAPYMAAAKMRGPQFAACAR